MSKIRIKGDTSGHVDLETSATGSNLSIGGDTTVTGNVAINGQLTTTGLGTTLSSNSYNVVKIQTDKDDTSAADGLLQFTHGSANTVKGEIRYDASESMFELGHGDNQGHIRINSSGYVTMPSQPFVRLQLSSHSFPNQSVSYPGNQVVGFTVKENVGNHWNSSNNNFTCPVAGVYTISVFFIKFPVTGHAHVDLHKNGSLVDNSVRWRAPEVNSGYHQAGGTVSVTCAANDVLDWHYFGDAGVHNTNGAWQIMLSH